MKKLHAGTLAAEYDNGFLRRITYGETEVLRMVYFALRDRNWNTLPARMENEQITIEDDSFDITYDCLNLDGGVTVVEWKAAISGSPGGTIVFEIRGRLNEDFTKNRAGFCVLHPLNIAGKPCEITHPDTTRSAHTFPVNVSPDNPFKNIQSMRWEASGVPFRLVFEGDIFETEDQRNWSDASYKTFCTPLDRPFPVTLKKGTEIFQRITFMPEQRLDAPERQQSGIRLSETNDRFILPFIGIGSSTEHSSLTTEALALLRDLHLRHYRVDLYPHKENWVTDFSNQYETAFSINVSLEVVLHLTDNFKEEIESFIILCKQNKVKLRKVLLLHDNGLVTDQRFVDEIPVLKAALPNTSVGAGTNYNFNELNKHRLHAEAVDFISFSIDPQEHAFDNMTILENMETQEHLVRTAKTIYGDDKPVHISPITLRKRFNPYATNPTDLYIRENLKADPRQKEVFAALWTFGSLCSLARGGANAVTLYQTVGNQGVMSVDGQPYPVYDTLKRFSFYQGKPIKILQSTGAHAVQGMLLDGRVLALANFTSEAQRVTIDNRDYVLNPFEIRFDQLNRA